MRTGGVEQAREVGVSERARERAAGRPSEGQASLAASVLALQRAAGNRAVAQVLEHRPEAVIQRQLRGKPNVRSGVGGSQLNEQQARAILRRLAAGDATALNLLDPVQGGGADPLTASIQQLGQPASADPYAQGREYGIIIEHGST